MNSVGSAVAQALASAAGIVYVGYSGGRDSTVLLHAVAARRRHGVTAVHVNHGLHPGADDWQRHCEGVARGLGVTFMARRVVVSPRGSLEARARAARYQVFSELLSEPRDRLFLAHHCHDQTETVLLRLLQGRGLYGMPAQRPLSAGTLVRPLLDVTPGELVRYARAHTLSWVEDPSNADERLDRNFLRLRLLPMLRARWPDLDRRVLDAMESHRLAEQRLMEPLGDLARAGSIAVRELASRPAAEAVELLRLWLQAHGQPPPGRAALEELLRQLSAAGDDRLPALSLGAASLRRHGGRVHLVWPQPALADRYAVVLPGITPLPHGSLELMEDPDGFQAVGPVAVRFRRGGERLRQAGGSRTLKTLFQEAGVPPWQRDIHPLLYDDAGLLAVPGVAHRHDPGRAGGRRWRALWRPDASAGRVDKPVGGRRSGQAGPDTSA